MANFAGKSIRRGAGVLLALLACVVAAPSKVQAGCTAHVRIPGIHGALLSDLDPSIAGQPAFPEAPGSPRPCSGPSCSGKPSVPALPSISETRYVEFWACLGLASPLPRRESGFATVASSRPLPVIAPDAIFHPPRATAPASRV